MITRRTRVQLLVFALINLEIPRGKDPEGYQPSQPRRVAPVSVSSEAPRSYARKPADSPLEPDAGGDTAAGATTATATEDTGRRRRKTMHKVARRRRR